MSTQSPTDLISLFAENGFARAEPALLQPADPFLDLSGEDIRRRLYLTHDAAGHELCLRPEYTIPVARDYLASAAAGGIAEFSYQGTVFRHRSEESGEFAQAGVESFGRGDREAADAQIFALALGAARALGNATPKARIGDVALLSALLDQLAVEPPLRRRLTRALANARPAAEVFEASAAKPASNGGLSAYSGVLTTLKNADGAEARAFVKDLLSIAGISTVGGRSAADIAERFLSQAGREGAALPGEKQALLQSFLALEGDPDAVAADLRALAKEAQLDLGAPLDALEQRIGFMAAEGVDLAALTMQTRFVRNLDYYTSFIFEIDSAVPGKPAIGGGRYDRLLARLGAASEIPAIGFAVYLARFGEPS